MLLRIIMKILAQDTVNTVDIACARALWQIFAPKNNVNFALYYDLSKPILTSPPKDVICMVIAKVFREEMS